jgi:hypothetical protein
MQKHLIIALALAFTSPASAHSDSKFIQGPNGGHIVDAGGGAQHWELVAAGGELTLYVTDSEEKPVETTGGAAEGKVLIGGKNHLVQFRPAEGNTMKATGEFVAAKGMRVIVKTTGVGGKSLQARLTPMK